MQFVAMPSNRRPLAPGHHVAEIPLHPDFQIRMHTIEAAASAAWGGRNIAPMLVVLPEPPARLGAGSVREVQSASPRTTAETLAAHLRENGLCGSQSARQDLRCRHHAAGFRNPFGPSVVRRARRESGRGLQPDRDHPPLGIVSSTVGCQLAFTAAIRFAASSLKPVARDRPDVAGRVGSPPCKEADFQRDSTRWPRAGSCDDAVLTRGQKPTAAQSPQTRRSQPGGFTPRG